jgi:hypothetical protein
MSADAVPSTASPVRCRSGRHRMRRLLRRRRAPTATGLLVAAAAMIAGPAGADSRGHAPSGGILRSGESAARDWGRGPADA